MGRPQRDRVTVWIEPVKARFFELVQSRENPSYDYIAKELNKQFGLDITRNACISFGKRNQIVRRLVNTGRRGGVPGSHRQRLEVSKSKKPPRAKKSEPIGCITFGELLFSDCRYPFGDRAPFTFCGKPKLENSPYCDEHTRIAWARTSRA